MNTAAKQGQLINELLLKMMSATYYIIKERYKIYIWINLFKNQPRY